jgi:phosphoribosylformylglycinamidine synthase
MDKPRFHAKVYITPKKGVLNPQGKAIEHSLHSLGFEEVGDVSLGKYVEMSLRDSDPQRAQARLDEMCRKLLANGVIEDYRFELSE